MLSRTELEGLTVTSALGGRMTRGFEMAGFLSRNDLVALLAGAVRTTVIAGGVAGNHVVAGIAVGDALRSVLSLAMDDHIAVDVVAAVDDHAAHTHVIPADTSTTPENAEILAGILGVGAGGAVQDAAAMGHADTGVDVVHGWAVEDLTAEFAITAANTINNGGGTDTTGRALIVVYEDLTP